MDGLVSYCSSGEEEDGSPHTTSQDVLDALKSKLPLNSAPPVPMKVGINQNTATLYIVYNYIGESTVAAACGPKG